MKRYVALGCSGKVCRYKYLFASRFDLTIACKSPKKHQLTYPIASFPIPAQEPTFFFPAPVLWPSRAAWVTISRKVPLPICHGSAISLVVSPTSERRSRIAHDVLLLVRPRGPADTGNDMIDRCNPHRPWPARRAHKRALLLAPVSVASWLAWLSVLVVYTWESMRLQHAQELLR